MLTIKKLSHAFGSLIVFDQLSFDFPNECQRLGILGPNGSGKTTLFNIISGFISAKSGEIFWNGDEIQRLRPDQINQKGIMRTFQIPHPFLTLSVYDNVYIAASEHHQKSEAHKTTSAILDMFNLLKKKDQECTALNPIDLRLLEICRAMATKPKLVLLDECLVGLHEAEQDHVLKNLLKLQKQDNFKIMMIEHNLSTMKSFCDYLIVLHLGKIIVQGPPEICLSDQKVQKIYFNT